MRNVVQLFLASLAKNVYACAATKITWSISDKVIGLEAKSPRNIVKMKEEMAAFLSVVVLWFCSTVRDGKLFWSKVLVICVF